jgi:hypothetical protein
MKRTFVLSLLAATFTTASVLAPFAAHAEDDLAKISVMQIGEINRRAQLLKQSEILSAKIEAFQGQYNVTIAGMRTLRAELKEAQAECAQICTSLQTQSIVKSVEKFSMVAGGTVAAAKGIGAAVGGLMKLSKNADYKASGAVVMNRHLSSFYTPWKTVAGRVMIAALGAYGVSAVVDNIIATNNRASQENIEHIQKDLNQRELTLQKVQANIAELNAQMRPITLALQQSMQLQSFSSAK